MSVSRFFKPATFFGHWKLYPLFPGVVRKGFVTHFPPPYKNALKNDWFQISRSPPPCPPPSPQQAPATGGTRPCARHRGLRLKGTPLHPPSWAPSPTPHSSVPAGSQKMCGVPYTIQHKRLALSHPPSAVSCQPSALSRQVSAVSHQPSAVRCQLSAVSRQPSICPPPPRHGSQFKSSL